MMIRVLALFFTVSASASGTGSVMSVLERDFTDVQSTIIIEKLIENSMRKIEQECVQASEVLEESTNELCIKNRLKELTKSEESAK